MSHADVFVFRVDLSRFENCSASRKKEAVSEIARSFVTSWISKALGVSCEEIRYGIGLHGKPYIVGNPLYFNVSHCGSIVAAAFCEEEIGIDIELVREYKETVMNRFFTTDERSYIVETEENSLRRERFFEIWTAKEAFLKLWGIGISGGFNFSIAKAEGLLDKLYSDKFGGAEIIHHKGEIKALPNDTYEKKIHPKSIDIYAYCLSVCGANLNSMRLISENQSINISK